MQSNAGAEVSLIKTVIDSGGFTALTVALMYAVKTLWHLVMSKDSQLVEERNKREELVRESIIASRSMFESTQKIVQALDRIERKVQAHDQDS
jgi:hypothetical protein